MAKSLENVVFLVDPPGGGAGVLLQALARASEVWHAGPSSDPVLRALPHADPSRSGWASHQLSAGEVAGNETALEQAFARALVNRERRALGDEETAAVTVVWNPRSALRVPFLHAAFPGCRFVLCVRDPAAACEEALRAWRSGALVSVPELAGWEGPPWSLPLIAGWRALSAQPLEQAVVEQWAVLAEQALDDLERLPGERWGLCDFDALLEHPRRELRRLCEFLAIAYDQALLTPIEETRRQLELDPPIPTDELLQRLDRTRPVMARLDQHRAPAQAPPTRAAREGTGASPFRSVFTGAFARVLSELQSSLLISTYQSGRLICARVSGGMLNTHLRTFDKPMGIAAQRERFALGTRSEIWDFRDMPAVAPKLEPAGRHDACFLPRNRHTTGDILIHELAFDGRGELWGVATAFSCLVTFDADSSFIPRWHPPFITELAPGDRCHLNGLCIRDGQPAYLSALGQTNSPGGWRERKATDGCLLELTSGEVIAANLSMPHSPRWHDGSLWLLESGRGELARVDLDTGTTETVAELPGFTRGLTIAGDLAFVGLSQIRESSTFGDLPLTHRLDERVCGVWAVDLTSGEVIGLLRFDDLIQEIFDVALLPGARYPEIAEPASTAVTTSFVLGSGS